MLWTTLAPSTRLQLTPTQSVAPTHIVSWVYDMSTALSRSAPYPQQAYTAVLQGYDIPAATAHARDLVISHLCVAGTRKCNVSHCSRFDQ
jgi:hypothetical protein